MYNQNLNSLDYNLEIKWSESLKNHHKTNRKATFNKELLVRSNYRPYIKQYYYAENIFSDRLTQKHTDIFGKSLNLENLCIWFKTGHEIPFFALAIKNIFDLLPQGGSQCLPLYRYDKSGNRQENITDWGIEQFREHYGDEGITREDIFHYVYAVLHNPAYRRKYEQNLKRDFPRIPFYPSFGQWVAWGKALMELHIGYEAAEPYPLEVVTAETKAEAKRQKEMFAVVEEPQAMFARQPKVKAKLKVVKESGIIELDELTLLRGIPAQAWEYKLGNRSALEWILDQYKEKKPKDPTIAEKFNTYRFADYKEQVIDLLKRVCTVSVETVRIVEEMGE